uniref:Large ribosomal subunit protein bL21c n=1 Tax=Pityrogramma trifoliata TaxID=164275 RepID=A0A3G5CR13_9MONI|nr:ribosomal protein L21 [Pityrogramma trifoliata]AYW15285.1 ribosomal protein L21 [Pityrogramma trifoliata]
MFFCFNIEMSKLRRGIKMAKYAIIDIGGNQLRVEPGRFYDVRHNLKTYKSDAKFSINRVLLIRNESDIDIGNPWLADAVVTGRILHNCFEKKLVIQKNHSKKKTRRIRGYRENLIRLVIESIRILRKDTISC